VCCDTPTKRLSCAAYSGKSHKQSKEAGVDSRVVALVRANFKAVVDAPGGPDWISSRFYGHMFGENPHFRALFPATMEMQRERFMTAVAFMLDNLDSHDHVVKFLEQLGRDHRKYGVEAEHYPAAGRALLASLRAYTGAAFWTDSIDAAWRQTIGLIVDSMAAGAAGDEFPAVWEAAVVGHRRVLDDLAVVRLQSDTPIPYEAGQYVPVMIPQRPRLWRYFSPAIPSNQYGEIEFHVRKVRGGWVSPSVVNETRVGDRWTIAAPLGGLRVDHDSGRDVLMIGCGTGIAPLRAQVMEMAQRGLNPRVHFFVGGHYPSDLYDVGNLWQLSLSNPWLTVIPVCESDTSPWWNSQAASEPPPGMHRRLIGPIGEVVAGLGAWSDRQVQIAGSPVMIRATVAALTSAGTPAAQIQHDPV
jgi:NAD(P)H-flavin reductase/hemoglobin-like flavoprotein